MYLNDFQNELDLRASANKKSIAKLNVLIIATFIGSVFHFLKSIYEWYIINYNLEYSNFTDNSVYKTADDITAMAKIQYEYRYIILAVGLISAVLCFYGAMKMRSNKKSGLYLYLVGEWSPIILSVLLFGFMSVMYVIPLIINSVIALLFTISYLAHAKQFN